jgi:hypothetical protein
MSRSSGSQRVVMLLFTNNDARSNMRYYSSPQIFLAMNNRKWKPWHSAWRRKSYEKAKHLMGFVPYKMQ